MKPMIPLPLTTLKRSMLGGKRLQWNKENRNSGNRKRRFYWTKASKAKPADDMKKWFEPACLPRILRRNNRRKNAWLSRQIQMQPDLLASAPKQTPERGSLYGSLWQLINNVPAESSNSPQCGSRTQTSAGYRHLQFGVLLNKTLFSTTVSRSRRNHRHSSPQDLLLNFLEELTWKGSADTSFNIFNWLRVCFGLLLIVRSADFVAGREVNTAYAVDRGVIGVASLILFEHF